jgi:hypothetical protein
MDNILTYKLNKYINKLKACSNSDKKKFYRKKIKHYKKAQGGGADELVNIMNELGTSLDPKNVEKEIETVEKNVKERIEENKKIVNEYNIATEVYVNNVRDINNLIHNQANDLNATDARLNNSLTAVDATIPKGIPATPGSIVDELMLEQIAKERKAGNIAIVPAAGNFAGYLGATIDAKVAALP